MFFISLQQITRRFFTYNWNVAYKNVACVKCHIHKRIQRFYIKHSRLSTSIFYTYVTLIIKIFEDFLKKMWTRKNKCDWISVLDYYRALKKYQYTVFIVQENIEKFNMLYSPPKKKEENKGEEMTKPLFEK